MGIEYHYDDRDPIEIKQHWYRVGDKSQRNNNGPLYYPHHLRFWKNKIVAINVRQLIMDGLMQIADSYTVDARFQLTEVGHQWLRDNGIEYIERSYPRSYQIEVATREQAMFVKLAWG